MTLPQAVRSIRKRCGESMTAFGRRLGVSFANISRYESGQLTPSPSVLLLLRQHAVTPEEVIGIDNALSADVVPADLIGGLRQGTVSPATAALISDFVSAVIVLSGPSGELAADLGITERDLDRWCRLLLASRLINLAEETAARRVA